MGIASFILRPVAAVYGGAVRLRNAAYDWAPALSRTAARPVLSVGGVRAGGTGKTPVALMVGKYLLSKGRAVAFLSRGYRRRDRRGRTVRPGEQVAWELVGDEPRLLHDNLPQSWLGIDARRTASVRRLAPLLPDEAVFVLDDGFQHRSIRRDLDIVCLHEACLHDRLIPAGLLRENLSSLARAHAALVIGSAAASAAVEKTARLVADRFPHLLTAGLLQEPLEWVNAADGRTAAAPPLKNPILVCGIGRPERFCSMVRGMGITPAADLVFPDHHRFIINDFAAHRELYSLGIITTEKDAVRLKGSGVVPDDVIWYLRTALRFTEKDCETAFWSLIDKTLSKYP